MMEKKPVIFDHDGGYDDLLSLMMLLCMPHIDLKGIVVTPADSYLRPALAATQKMLRLFRRTDIPVSAGTLPGVHPFPPIWRADAYRINALPILNEPDSPLAEPVGLAGHQFIADQLQKAAEPITLLVTGPVTNIAAALETNPHLQAHVAEVIWMGGALDTPGNVRDYEHDGSAEWNVYWDPPAAARLWQTAVPIRLFPLDATDKVPVTFDFLVSLARQRRFAVSDLAGQIWAMTVGTIPAYEYTYHMWDTLTTGYLAMPEHIRFREVFTIVQTELPSAGRIKAVAAAENGRRIQAACDIDVDAFLTGVLNLFRCPLPG